MKLSCPINPASTLCNFCLINLRPLHLFQSVASERRILSPSFSRVTLRRRKSGGVKRAYYRVNGYATEPLRLLEADMPSTREAASRFSSRHELDGVVIAVKSREEDCWNYHTAVIYRLQTERAIMQLVIAFVNTRQSMAHSPTAVRLPLPSCMARLLE